MSAARVAHRNATETRWNVQARAARRAGGPGLFLRSSLGKSDLLR